MDNEDCFCFSKNRKNWTKLFFFSGHLLIAEVESRFDDADAFTKEVMKLGFKLKNLDKKHQVFFFMEFVKIRDPPAKKSKLPQLTLKPCLYKRRWIKVMLYYIGFDFQ